MGIERKASCAADLVRLMLSARLYVAPNESVHDYERDHLPTEAWPPTNGFVPWSQGRNVFAVDPGKEPMELRWLVFRRR